MRAKLCHGPLNPKHMYNSLVGEQKQCLCTSESLDWPALVFVVAPLLTVDINTCKVCYIYDRSLANS